MADMPKLKSFSEALELFNGDRSSAAWHLVSQEASERWGCPVNNDRSTAELVIAVNEAEQICPKVPGAQEIEKILSSAVRKFGIPDRVKPIIAGARVQRYYYVPSAL